MKGRTAKGVYHRCRGPSFVHRKKVVSLWRAAEAGKERVSSKLDYSDTGVALGVLIQGLPLRSIVWTLRKVVVLILLRGNIDIHTVVHGSVELQVSVGVHVGCVGTVRDGWGGWITSRDQWSGSVRRRRAAVSMTVSRVIGTGHRRGGGSCSMQARSSVGSTWTWTAGFDPCHGSMNLVGVGREKGDIVLSSHKAEKAQMNECVYRDVIFNFFLTVLCFESRLGKNVVMIAFSSF
jgi:hypothetical protein